MSAADTLADFRTLWHMLRGQRRRGDHAQRLQAYYAPQAEHYDAFRATLLHGRRELIERLAPQPRSYVIELGCGTGANLDFLGERRDGLRRIDLVDVCLPLLQKARQRAALWRNVNVIQADACSYRPDEPADSVYFSYALTMMPDWRGALDNAARMLRPGGRLGVVDFYLPQPGGLAAAFWRRWFAHDGVYLSADHLPELCRRMPRHVQHQCRARVPYLPGLRAPYYMFVGDKP